MPHYYCRDYEKILMERCDSSGGEDSCWLWSWGCFSDGYGQIKVRGKAYKAHRLSWEVFKGPIPMGLMVCHHCDNKSCVNPKHLFLGTAQDNMDDMVAKGRDNKVGVKGEDKYWCARLTEEDVRLLRKLKAQGWSSRALATRFQITKVHVNSIVRYQYWKHI